MTVRIGEYSFDIDDSWVQESGIDLKSIRDKHFISDSSQSKLVKLSEIFPNIRNAGVPIFKDGENNEHIWQTARQRVLAILEAIDKKTPMPPVKIMEIGDPSFKYKLVDGCHRFHLSAVVGFDYIPTLPGSDINSIW